MPPRQAIPAGAFIDPPAPPPMQQQAEALPGYSESKAIERTSLAQRQASPNEVTLRFMRFTTWNLTAYQKGQYAGFLLADAQRLIAAGAAILAAGPGQFGPGANPALGK